MRGAISDGRPYRDGVIRLVVQGELVDKPAFIGFAR